MPAFTVVGPCGWIQLPLCIRLFARGLFGKLYARVFWIRERDSRALGLELKLLASLNR